MQAKSYHIPTIRLFSQYGTATGGIEHAAGLVTPLETNPRGGDLRFGSRGQAGGGGGGKVRIWAFAEFGANGQFLTEIAVGTTASCTLAYLSPLISVKFCFGKGPLVYLGWCLMLFWLRTDQYSKFNSLAHFVEVTTREVHSATCISHMLRCI